MYFSSIEEKVIYNKLKPNASDKNINNTFESLVQPPPFAFKLQGTSTTIAELLSMQSRYLDIMGRTRFSNTRRVLASNRKYIGRFIVFGKKVIRKLIAWYLEPLCKRQSEFNSATMPAIGKLTESVIYLEHRLQSLTDCNEKIIIQHRADIESYAARITELEKQLQVASDQITRFQSKLISLEKMDLDISSNEKSIEK